jgi:16S rRNA (uracil1498-N3)-methyltransferase
MRIPRIYLSQPLSTGNEVELDSNALRHVVQVLRLKSDHPLILFNGNGGEFEAQLVKVEKRQAVVRVGQFHAIDRESSLMTQLGLGISKGERMDFSLQKAVELGVSEITPLFTEHCVVQLSPSRVLKKQEHWQGVIISACEQSGRNTIPKLNAACSYSDWLSTRLASTRLVLDPEAGTKLSKSNRPGRLVLKALHLVRVYCVRNPPHLPVSRQFNACGAILLEALACQVDITITALLRQSLTDCVSVRRASPDHRYPAPVPVAHLPKVGQRQTAWVLHHLYLSLNRAVSDAVLGYPESSRQYMVRVDYC